MAKTVVEKAVDREYRRVRKMVVSMRVHALYKRDKSAKGSTEYAFYAGQEDALNQLLGFMEPQVGPLGQREVREVPLYGRGRRNG